MNIQEKELADLLLKSARNPGSSIERAVEATEAYKNLMEGVRNRGIAASFERQAIAEKQTQENSAGMMVGQAPEAAKESPADAYARMGIETDVLAAIVSERCYQLRKWPNDQHTVGEWILIVAKCCADAHRAWVVGHGDNQALHELRQIVAVGVAALEQHGAPLRGEPVSKS